MSGEFEDVLDRVFGPDPDNATFPPFNEAKIIPTHDCDWPTKWAACTVCNVQRSESVTRSLP